MSGRRLRASGSIWNAEGSTPAIEITPHITLLSYEADLLRHLARRLLQDHSLRLPDLSHSVVLLPDGTAAPRLRRLLLAQAASQGHGALLGPCITTLADWLDDFLPEGQLLASRHSRELMLLEALQRHARLCGAGGPWALADSLLALFEELARQAVSLPEDPQQFSECLVRAYGLADEIEPQSREARLVFSLWQAWQAQHREEQVHDRQQSHRERLALSLARLPAELHFYLAGHDQLLHCETDWLRMLLRKGRATLLLQGQVHPEVDADHCHPAAVCRRLLEDLDLLLPTTPTDSDNDYAAFLDAAFAPQAATAGPGLDQRARAFAAALPDSPAAQRLLRYAARDPEEEARAVELQVRRWLLAGMERIAIISEDRRLARRIRALLERAGVMLQDNVGWTLSTTSAAAALERLLQTAEEDYAHEPLLDLLKSPFIFPDLERDELLQRVYRLEQDIILHENISRGLGRYRQHLAYRRQRLEWPAQTQQELDELLDRLEAACTPLQALMGDGGHRPETLLAALGQALTASGLAASLAQDAAGSALLEELAALEQAVAGRSLRFTWTEFRTWLGRTLENATFSPPQAGAERVQLFTLPQSNLQCFDGLIIAAADESQLPGPPAATPFFNDAVRRELGLLPGRWSRTLAFHHFRRLLESAPRVLLTYHRREDGEDIQPAPWLALLDAFHCLGYGSPLDDDGLGTLLRSAATQVVVNDAPLPTPAAMPRPAAARALLPEHYSAGRYQRLVDCPYLFHAADCLGLKAPERIREAL
ncbi:MAG: DNA helicase, partial [Gammaproteobacteria bacterium]